MITVELFKRWTQPHSVVLTPNQRLARFITEQLNDWQQLKSTSWESSAVFPISAWLTQLWQCAFQHQWVAPQLLLNSAQTQLLWKELLTTLDNRMAPLASEAEKTWRLSQQWQLDLHSPIFQINETTHLWQKAALMWPEYLTAHQYIDTPLSQNIVMEIISLLAKYHLLPKQIDLVNFLQHTPWQKKFFDCLNTHGVNITSQKITCIAHRLEKYCCPTPEAEIDQMLHWVKNKANTTPLVRIACLTPNLSLQQNTLSQQFLMHFSSSHLFEIVQSKPLTDYALIEHSLLLLELLLPEISANTLCTLIRSPFIKGALPSISERALWENRLRLHLSPWISHENLHHYFTHVAQGCAQWQQSFLQLPLLANDTQQSAKEWLTLFQQCWEHFGWPGDRSLSSEEYQLLQHWHETLTHFANLTHLQKNIGLKQALDNLTLLFQKTLFQPQAALDTRIHVYPILEAAGLPFDAIWVMGMNDQVWPEAPAPNPFIPYSLQRKLQLPYATTQQTWEFSKLITQQLKVAASEIIFSYAETDLEKHYHPSPLLQEIPLTATPLIAPTISTINLETLTEDMPPALSVPHDTTYGSDIFKSQAQCPFQAFARYRLNAKSIAALPLGLVPHQRGQLIHSVLEQIWRELRTHQTLCELSEEMLRACIKKNIFLASEKFIATQRPLVTPLFFAIEQWRLQEIIFAWLQHEKLRAPFTVIATESQLQTEIAGLSLRLRIDRIDQLSNQQYLLLDYKTGECSINHWLEERLTEPQLPLYCVTSPLPISGLMFAQLKPDSTKFKGIGKIEFTEKKEKKQKIEFTIDELKIRWQQQLQQLALEYQQGHALVSPKEGKETCRRCDLSLLCRVQENSFNE